MNHESNPTVLTAAPAAPRFASREPLADSIAAASESRSSELGQLLTRLIADESALYAITREWRYDAAGRKFLRLHTLLDEQFTEIGMRLMQLAARSRALGCWASTGHGDRPEARCFPVEGGGLEAHMLGELLSLHEALLARLREGKRATGCRASDRKTKLLLADLIAQHEKDASMLRGVLSEVQFNAA